jgi:hypothetical protein
MTANYYFCVNGQKYRIFQNAAGWPILIDLVKFVKMVYTYLDEAEKLHKYVKAILHMRIRVIFMNDPFNKIQPKIKEQIDNLEVDYKKVKDMIYSIEKIENEISATEYKNGFYNKTEYSSYLKTPGILEMLKKLFQMSEVINSDGSSVSNWEDFMKYFIDKDDIVLRGDYICQDNGYIFAFHRDSRYD